MYIGRLSGFRFSFSLFRVILPPTIFYVRKTQYVCSYVSAFWLLGFVCCCVYFCGVTSFVCLCFGLCSFVGFCWWVFWLWVVFCFVTSLRWFGLRVVECFVLIPRFFLSIVLCRSLCRLSRFRLSCFSSWFEVLMRQQSLFRIYPQRPERRGGHPMRL